MKFFVKKQVKILSIGFLFIFLGFTGVERYITPFFQEAGMVEVGFWSLILIYLFFALSDPLAAVFVSKYGAKISMIFASVFYSLYIFFLVLGSVPLIYLASILVGISASLLWTGENTFLIRASDQDSYGENSGFFNSVKYIGSALSVLLLGFFISKYLFKNSFLIFAFFPLVAIVILSRLKNLRMEKRVNRFKLVKKAIFSLTALRISTAWFVLALIHGFVIGIIPIEIKNTLGMSYLGPFLALFYVFPICFSYLSGRVSDIVGRPKMLVLSYFFIIISLISLALSGEAFFLVLGIVLVALTWTIMPSTIHALVGDISTEHNLEFLTGLFWMVQSFGTVIALVISQLFRADPHIIYLISIIIALSSFINLIPLLKLGLDKIKEKLSQEIA